MNPAQEIINRMKFAVGLMLGLIGLSTYGFMHIMDWSLIDALWMTVMTITTVGYAEVHPLNTVGRIFAMFVMLLGVGIVFWALGLIVQLFVGEEVKNILELKRMEKNITKLKGHYIVVHYGLIGRGIVEAFRRRNTPFVVIEDRPEQLRLLKESKCLYIDGNPQSDKSMHAAGIERARAVLIAGDDMADNLVVVLTVKGLNKDATVIAKAHDAESEKKLRRAGADMVVSSASIAANRMASVALRPTVVDFLDTAMQAEGAELEMEEIPVEEGAPAATKTIADTRIRDVTGSIVIGIVKKDGRMRTNPSGAERLDIGDKIVAIGSEEQLDKLWHMLAKQERTTYNGMRRAG